MPETVRDTPTILTVNAGSSSVKWAVFRVDDSPVRTASGHIERIGLADGVVTVTDPRTGRQERRVAQVLSRADAAGWLIKATDGDRRGGNPGYRSSGGARGPSVCRPARGLAGGD